ncbi:MAG TPA: GNAT family N-acetyltransferase, partial [Verrucomicrobiae bacterium]|nr:GNAT family N-acetyltransferase [Verrucomicrobiae bacterium]
PGILAYSGDRAVGWCAVAPRAALSALERSRILQPVDDQPVWSITCFFVAKPYRRRGLTVKLIEAAAAHARKGGATIVEGYPVEPRKGAMPDVFAFIGLAAAFRRAGFTEVARRSDARPIMRRTLRKAPPRRSVGLP